MEWQKKTMTFYDPNIQVLIMVIQQVSPFQKKSETVNKAWAILRKEKTRNIRKDPTEPKALKSNLAEVIRQDKKVSKA
jgi:hypothetical protein